MLVLNSDVFKMLTARGAQVVEPEMMRNKTSLLLARLSQKARSAQNQTARFSMQPLEEMQLVEPMHSVHSKLGNAVLFSKSADEAKRKSDWELNVGRAIDILRRDLPGLLQHGIPDTSPYSRDICFSEPHHLKLHTRGLVSYLALVRLAKSGMSMYYDHPKFEIVHMNQIRANGQPTNSSDVSNDSDVALSVRWVIEGTSRPALLASGLFSATHRGPGGKLGEQAEAIEPSVFEGVFVYRFDSNGLISEHILENLEPTPPSWFKSWSGFARFRPAV